MSSSTDVVVTEPSAALDLKQLTLGQMSDIGKVFAQSGMFKDTKGAAQAVTKILAGQELGIPPMQAMRGYHIVDGNPQMAASLIAALIKRSGKYDYRITAISPEACTIEWAENGTTTGTSTFTLEQAKAAGLAGKTNWKSYAEDMLFARALTRGARRHCPDVFGGAVYAIGEPVDVLDERPSFEDRPVQQLPTRAPEILLDDDGNPVITTEAVNVVDDDARSAE